MVEGPPPPGTPFRHPHSEQRRPARAHAVGPVLGPHARTDRTRDTRVAEPWLPAPEGGQLGEGQRLTPHAPHNGGRPPPPGDGPPPPPRHAAPTGRAGQVDSVGPPHPHTRARKTWVAHPNSPPSGRAVGGGGAPDLRRPSQWWKAPPPGRAPHHPRGTQPPQGVQAKWTVLGPHTHTPAPAARGWRTPTARPVGGQSGEGERLTSDAPHNGGRHPPRGRPSATPKASNAGPQGRTLWGRCWVLTPAPTAPGTHGSRNPGCPPQRTGGRGRDSACHQTPHTTVAGHPPRGPPPGTPAARSSHRACRPRGQCWAPTPTHPRPQHVGGRPQQPTQWAGSRGRGAPDLRRPSQRWKAPPPGTPFRHPHTEQRRPARAHAVEPLLGPHARSDRTRNTRVAVPRLPAPEDGRSGEGQRLTPDAPHNGGRPPPPPPGTVPHHPRGTQSPQGMQAKGTVLGPHTHTPAPTALG